MSGQARLALTPHEWLRGAGDAAAYWGPSPRQRILARSFTGWLALAARSHEDNVDLVAQKQVATGRGISLIPDRAQRDRVSGRPVGVCAACASR